MEGPPAAPKPGGGRGGGRGRGARAAAEKGEAAGGGKGRGARAEGGRREGARREDGEASADAALVPQGVAAGRYSVVGLVAFSGQPRPAFLESLVRVPLPTVPLPDIPAFPNPSPRPAAPTTAAAPAAALRASACAANDSAVPLETALSALALDGERQVADASVHRPAAARADGAGAQPPREGHRERGRAEAAAKHDMEGSMEAYQDVDAKIMYIFLPYPEPEVGTVDAGDSYYSLEQQTFRWECQVASSPCVYLYICMYICMYVYMYVSRNDACQPSI
jgi:hypothetical protein